MNMHAVRREMPASIEAEQALLGALIINNSTLAALPPQLEPEHFFEALHRQIFSVIGNLVKAGKSANPVTIKTYLPGDVRIGELSISQYLARLAAEAVSVVNVRDYAAAIIFYAQKRRLQSTAEYLSSAAFDGASELDLLSRIEEVTEELRETRQALELDEGKFSLTEALNRSISAIDDAYHKRGPIGLRPGIDAVEELMGTIQPNDLIVIGGKPKHGKTALGMQMTFEIARAAPVLVYSGEMSERELLQRELARRTGISHRRQKHGRVSEAEMEALVRASVEIQNLQPIEIETQKMTIEQIAQRARLMKRSKGLGLILIDHLGKLGWGRRMSDEDTWKQGEVATGMLKDLAAELDVPVIAVTHLKKSGFTDGGGRAGNFAQVLRATMNRRPRITDLMGNMDRDANHVLIPFQPSIAIADIEPAEGTEDWNLWKEMMDAHAGRAEIILSLSRSEDFPRRREVRWNGETTSFGPGAREERYERELF